MILVSMSYSLSFKGCITVKSVIKSILLMIMYQVLDYYNIVAESFSEYLVRSFMIVDFAAQSKHL